MKVCKDCEFCSDKAAQDDRGNIGRIMICLNKECGDVLDGHPIPCANARNIPQYCGFEARYFKLRIRDEEGNKVVHLIQQGKQ